MVADEVVNEEGDVVRGSPAVGDRDLAAEVLQVGQRGRVVLQNVAADALHGVADELVPGPGAQVAAVQAPLVRTNDVEHVAQ